MIKRLSQVLAVVAMALPLTVLASGAEHGAAPEHVPFSVWFHTVNLAIMIGILYYFGRTPLRNYLVQRQDTVRSALKRAELARAEAEARAAEYEAKLAELEAQAVQQRARIEAEAREEVARMVEHAHHNAEQMKQQTSRLLDEELRAMREKLRSESIALALDLAREMVTGQITEADHQRLLMNYINDVKSSEVN